MRPLRRISRTRSPASATDHYMGTETHNNSVGYNDLTCDSPRDDRFTRSHPLTWFCLAHRPLTHCCVCVIQRSPNSQLCPARARPGHLCPGPNMLSCCNSVSFIVAIYCYSLLIPGSSMSLQAGRCRPYRQGIFVHSEWTHMSMLDCLRPCLHRE